MRPPPRPSWRAATAARRAGNRCQAAIPHGHWKTTTLVCGLRAEGLTAPMVLDGALDGATFSAYVQALLVPTLRVGDLGRAGQSPRS